MKQILTLVRNCKQCPNFKMRNGGWGKPSYPMCKLNPEYSHAPDSLLKRHAVARGDLFTGEGEIPAWCRLEDHVTARRVLRKTDYSGCEVNKFKFDELNKYPHTKSLIEQWQKNGFKDKQHAISNSLLYFKSAIDSRALDEVTIKSYIRVKKELLEILKQEIQEDINQC